VITKIGGEFWRRSYKWVVVGGCIAEEEELQLEWPYKKLT
jgi:hypothetical protein